MKRPDVDRSTAARMAQGLRCGALASIATGLVVGLTASFPAQAESPLQLDAPTLFKRVQDSAAQRSYIGTFVVSVAGNLSSSRVTHYCKGSDQIDKLESLDGQMRRIYRHNDVVHILWPQNHEASIEPRELMGRWLGPGASVARPERESGSGARPASAGTALESYEVLRGKGDRVAGYEAQVVTLRPRDNWRYGQRWWLERDTGLLLRSDLIGPNGDLLESAGFSELQIGVKLQPQQLLQEMNNLQGYRVQQPHVTRTSLEQEGWTLRQPVPGFKPYACVRRAAPNRPAAGVQNAARDPLLQAIYSDGLTHVSLFIEPFDETRHGGDHPPLPGATHMVGRRDGSWWITAVGSVPTATLQAFSQGMARLRP